MHLVENKKMSHCDIKNAKIKNKLNSCIPSSISDISGISDLIYSYAKFNQVLPELKRNIRLEYIKKICESRDEVFNDELDELKKCRCCTRHHPELKENETYSNKWRFHRHVYEKKCSCPCRHLYRCFRGPNSW